MYELMGCGRKNGIKIPLNGYIYVNLYCPTGFSTPNEYWPIRNKIIVDQSTTADPEPNIFFIHCYKCAM